MHDSLDAGQQTPPVCSGEDRSRTGRRLTGWNASLSILLLVLFFGVAVLLQSLAGAYRADLNGYPDEPAHLLTGLMVRDYVMSGFSQRPMQFAEAYYLHYPKIAFGIWPPLFHFTEAVWFLLIPPSRAAALVLQALITAGLAASLAVVTVRRFGWVIGLAAGLAFTALPTVQSFTGMVMADNLMALIAFWAMLAIAGYLRDGTTRQAVLAGALVGLALATKSNGAAAGLIMPIALVLRREYRRLVTWRTLLAAAVALAIALPWQILAASFWTRTLSANPQSWSRAVRMLGLHAIIYSQAVGFVILTASIIGFICEVVLPYRQQKTDPFWASAAGLLGGMFLFGMAPFPAEPRYHVAGYAALVLFAASGVSRLAAALPLRWIPEQVRRPALVALAALLFAITTFSVPPRNALGFAEAAEALISNPAFRNSVVLVSSGGGGEGMYIAEVALRERRPSHYLLRASKVLARSRWDGDAYEMIYTTQESLMQYLKSIPVSLVVLDEMRGPGPPDHLLLAATVAQHPTQWRLAGAFPSAGTNSSGGRVRMYQYTGEAEVNGKTPADNIKVDMEYTLGKTLKQGR